MSQVDKVHFFPSLIWVISLFIVWYILMISWVFPTYYRVFRTRLLFELKLFNVLSFNDFW